MSSDVHTALFIAGAFDNYRVKNFSMKLPFYEESCKISYGYNLEFRQLVDELGVSRTDSPGMMRVFTAYHMALMQRRAFLDRGRDCLTSGTPFTSSRFNSENIYFEMEKINE